MNISMFLLRIVLMIGVHFIFIFLAFNAKKHGHIVCGIILLALSILSLSWSSYSILLLSGILHHVIIIFSICISLAFCVAMVWYSIKEDEQKNKLWRMFVIESYFLMGASIIQTSITALNIIIILAISMIMVVITKKSKPAVSVWITNCCILALCWLLFYVTGLTWFVYSSVFGPPIEYLLTINTPIVFLNAVAGIYMMKRMLLH